MCASQAYRANLHRRAVSRELQAWQHEADITTTALAEAAGCSIAKMSMLLNAVCPISQADLLTLALILKAKPARRELAFNSLVRSLMPDTWDGRSCLSWELDDLEAEAIELRIVAGELLPPLLQTPGYAGASRAPQAAALFDHRRPYSHEQRRKTLARLTEVTPLRMNVVVSEAGLRRMIGGRRVMADQVLWLLQLCELESVRLQVAPAALGSFPGLGSAFTCLSFLERQLDDLVAVEQLHQTTWLEAPEEREPYEHTFLKAQETAWDEPESIEFVAGLLDAT